VSEISKVLEGDNILVLLTNITTSELLGKELNSNFSKKQY